MSETFGMSPEEYHKANEAWKVRCEQQKRKAQERRRIMAEGKTCAKCGGELGDRVYRYEKLLTYTYTFRTKPTTDVDPLCEECAPDWLPELKTVVNKLYTYSHNAPCETCGREVFYVSGFKKPPGRVFCCDECKAKRPAKARPLSAHKNTCEVCGKEFVSKRSDAKACSPACRQKKYRMATAQMSTDFA